ncbi:MAG TPA: ACT domain-containing protein [Bryobacteraceae bacterium]|nr:ACT domain-containing protein [Bryobacteraceae bacterium]
MTSTELGHRAAATDTLVKRAFTQISPATTVLAVGGYGRGELFPFSDIDLLLLIDLAEPPREDRDKISEFLRVLWDAGLRVSQSVRTVKDCCEIHEGNLELTISLLDQRLLCGEPRRWENLTTQFPKFLAAERARVVRHLCQMTRARHAKFGNTIYHLEPNVKEHPGGLRDLHTMHWLRLLRAGDSEDPHDAREFLFEVRSRLHERAGRDYNLLDFESQEAFSPEPAAWMREYYRNARWIFRSVQQAMEASEGSDSGLLYQFRDWRSRLSNAEFTVLRERVLLREPGKLSSDPASALRLIQFVARHGFRLARDTQRRVEAALADLADIGKNAWPALREILRLPHSSLALRTMQETGLLAALIPEWKRIDCLVVRDFYHRYTVDEHTLVTLDSLDGLRRAEDPSRQRFRELLEEVDQPELIRLALILHDIGKGGGKGNHSEESTRIGREVMARLAVPEEQRDTVEFLVKRHLDLSSILSSRDLNERETARTIAEHTGTAERLRMLTLLTFCDVSAVNPTAMSPWRLEQLWRTYLLGYQELTRELESERIRAKDTPAEETDFLAGFPARYLRTHTPAEIAAHRELAQQSGETGAAVALQRTGVWRMTVAAADRPFLLASVSGALASFGVNILKAEAFSNDQGLVLDTFAFSDPLRTLELNPTEVDRLRDTVLRTVLGKTDVKQLLKHRRAPKPASNAARVKPAVVFDNGSSERATLIEIVAQDRPGLLHDLAQTISSNGLNIDVVLIDTEAHKALDVFYVTSSGEKIPPETQPQLQEKLLAVCRG